jgi:HK97 family phage major capsid protein
LANNPRDFRAQIQARLARAWSILDGAAGRSLSAGERATVESLLDEMRVAKGRLDESLRDRELRNSLDDIGRMDAPDDTKEDKALEDSAYDFSTLGEGTKGRSITDQLLNSPRFQSWYKSVAPSGVISEGAKGLSSPPVQVRMGLKALLTGASDTSAGAMVFSDRAPFVGPPGRRELTLRDLISVVPTDSDTIEFAKWNSETNAAAPVAEATAVSGTTGTKPESAMDFATVSVPVRNVAHWMPVTRRAMADAPQLRALIDDALLYGLAEELEDQMLAGDGTGQNFTGLANVSGVQTQAWAGSNLKTLLLGRSKVRTVGRARPTAFLLHPQDVDNLLLATDTTGRYMLADPGAGNPYSNFTCWGLPVVVNEGIAAGTGYVGDFRELYLFDRSKGPEVYITDSHSDLFVRNILIVLAELRAGFCVRRPASIVKFTALSVGGS